MTPGDPKCEAALEFLVDLEAGGGPPELRDHVATCPVCQARLRDARARHAASAGSPPGRMRTTAQIRPAAPSTPARGWLGMAVVVVVISAVVVGLSAMVLQFSQQPPSVDLKTEQLVQVDIDLAATRTLSQARMRIELPAGLQLESNEAVFVAMRRLDYTTDLHAGSNRLSLVLRATEAGVHRVQVQVDAGGEQAATEVVLRVAQAAHVKAAAEPRYPVRPRAFALRLSAHIVAPEARDVAVHTSAAALRAALQAPALVAPPPGSSWHARPTDLAPAGVPLPPERTAPEAAPAAPPLAPVPR